MIIAFGPQTDLFTSFSIWKSFLFRTWRVFALPGELRQPPLIRKGPRYSTYTQICDICDGAGVRREENMGWRRVKLLFFFTFLMIFPESVGERKNKEFWFVFAKHMTLHRLNRFATVIASQHRKCSLQSYMKFKTVQMRNKWH